MSGGGRGAKKYKSTKVKQKQASENIEELLMRPKLPKETLGRPLGTQPSFVAMNKGNCLLLLA